MKNLITIFIISFLTNLGHAQNVIDRNSSMQEHPFGEYLNHCFEDLEPVEYLRIHRMTKDMNLCNLAVVSFLDIYYHDSLLTEAIFIRLRQIAKRFYDNGTPLFIIGTGMSSIESCQRLNKEINPYGITYVSLGNTCLSSRAQGEGILVFNTETKRLVNYIEPILETKKKKRKHNKSKHN